MRKANSTKRVKGSGEKDAFGGSESEE